MSIDYETIWWIGLCMAAPSVIMSAGLLIVCFWAWLSVFKTRRERLLLFSAVCVAALSWLGCFVMRMADQALSLP